MSSQRVTPAKSVWKTSADGRTTFRLNPPLVLWWAWAVFAVANVLDLVIESRDWFSVQITAALLVVTGFMYACALRPRVMSDASGLTVRNPFRDYRVPWGRVSGIFLGDSVEIQYEQPPPQAARTIYSWALYSPRRARARTELRMAGGARRQRHDQRAQQRFQVPDAAAGPYGKAPAGAREMASQHPGHVMASELGRRWNEAQAASARAGAGGEAESVAVTWAWRPIAAVLAPAALLVAVIVAH